MVRLFPLIAALTGLGAALAPAQAASINAEFARELAAVVSGAEPCGLTFKPEAVEKLIGENVTIADLGFTEALQSALSFNKMTRWPKLNETERATACIEIRRNAVAYGFID